MNEEERDAIAKYVATIGNACRTIIEDGDHLLNVLGKPYTEEQPKTEKPTLEDISSLKYEDKESDKGPYKMVSKSGNPNNPAFQKLQKYLKDHDGFAVLHGFKFWIFSNNSDIIGRRKQ